MFHQWYSKYVGNTHQFDPSVLNLHTKCPKLGDVKSDGIIAEILNLKKIFKLPVHFSTKVSNFDVFTSILQKFR